jgi:hypothetical protein
VRWGRKAHGSRRDGRVALKRATRLFLFLASRGSRGRTSRRSLSPAGGTETRGLLLPQGRDRARQSPSPPGTVAGQAVSLSPADGGEGRVRGRRAFPPCPPPLDEEKAGGGRRPSSFPLPRWRGRGQGEGADTRNHSTQPNRKGGIKPGQPAPAAPDPCDRSRGKRKAGKSRQEGRPGRYTHSYRIVAGVFT